MKKLNLIITLIAAFIIISCSNDKDSIGKISLDIAAVKTKSANNKSLKMAAEVIFTDFRISIRDVVFKNDNDPNSNLDTDEIQFRGPFQIDLLDNTNAIRQTIGQTIVPDGLYKELRFKFHKDENLPSSDKLFDRSIYIEGTIDDTPFVFWHDTSENFDLGRPTGVVVENGTVNFIVQFDMSQFLSSLHQIDLSQATDNNDDGTIEIFPNDSDGNQNIAKELKENIKMSADLVK